MPSTALARPAQQRRPAAEVDYRDSVAPSLLWSPTIVARWAGVGGAAALVLVGSWFIIAGKPAWEDQRPWMSLAIAALVAVAFVSLNLLLAGRRAIGLRRVELLGDLPVPLAAAAAPVSAPTAAASSEVLVSGDGRLRYHRADCPLTAGRGYVPAERAAHAGAGRLPCGVCLP